MLTPAFELTQDEKYVYVYIRTPYIKIGDVEYVIEEHLFKFYVKPYFLRLHFPGKIVENGNESASYDVEKGSFTVRLPKHVPGENFPDLDLVTKLLAPSGKCTVLSPGIEVISEKTACSDNDHEDHDDQNDDLDWEWCQEIYDDEKERELAMAGSKYGFANQKNGVFHRLKDELKDVVENPNPDELSYSERTLARIAAENLKFDEEHYLADFFEDERLKEISSYVIEKEVSFSECEKEKLRQFPNREYILDNKEEISVWYSLVDIMFSFAYDKRTTLGDNTVESAWTIAKLSSTLSWFERFTSLGEVLKACIRRSLSYPLYRNWKLSCKVLQDVKDIFQLGRRKILKCLLEIFMLFNASEPRYLLNELYITDYCIWIQKVKKCKLESLTNKLLEIKITKDVISLDLKDLETAAILVYNEEKCHASDSESSSSDDSTDWDVDEMENNDSTDNTDTDSPIKQKGPECSKKAGSSKGKIEKSYEAKGTGDLSSAKSESDPENQTFSEIKGLPPLFPKQNFDGKKLVEFLGDDEDASSGSCRSENTNFDDSPCQEDKTNGTIYEGGKELVLTHDQEDTGSELSCKLSGLVMSE